MQEEYPTEEYPIMEEDIKMEEMEEEHETFEGVEILEGKSEDIARKAILNMARTWEDNGDIYQATMTYKDLIKKAPETQEGEEAKEGLLRIAQLYQEEGATNSALSIYKYVMEN